MLLEYMEENINILFKSLMVKLLVLDIHNLKTLRLAISYLNFKLKEYIFLTISNILPLIKIEKYC